MRRINALLCTFIICVSVFQFPVFAAEPSYAAEREAALDDLLKHYSGKKDLTDWEAIVLGINGVEIKAPWLGKSYFGRVEDEVKSKNGELRLATDYARLIVAYRSHGKDASNIAGYDFIEKLKQFENMENQGINAYTWALTALRGEGENITRPLIENILAYQTEEGGFSFKREPGADASADADLTAMAVTALVPYAGNGSVGIKSAASAASPVESRDNLTDAAVFEMAVRSSIDKAVGYLLTEPSVYSNCESAAQTVIAFCSAGIETDAKLTAALESFRLEDGLYTHTLETDKADAIATVQAALALTALERYENGLGGIYE